MPISSLFPLSNTLFSYNINVNFFSFPVFIGRPLARTVTPTYEDETYKPSGQNRPNPRKLSNALFRDPRLEDDKKDYVSPVPSRTRKTALFAYFGKISLLIFHYLNTVRFIS